MRTNYLRKIRLQKKMRIVDLAAKAGVHQSSIVNLERKRYACTKNTAMKIAEVLEVELHEVFPFYREYNRKDWTAKPSLENCAMLELENQSNTVAHKQLLITLQNSDHPGESELRRAATIYDFLFCELDHGVFVKLCEIMIRHRKGERVYKEFRDAKIILDREEKDSELELAPII